MKKMRIPLIIVFAIAVIGVVLGSFFDLQISQAIADRNNGFGLTVSVIGPTIGFSGLAIIGGGFLALALQKGKPIWKTILFIVLALGCYGGGVYYGGVEYFGENGFYRAAPNIVGFLIAAVLLAGAVFLGYWLFKDNTNPYTWIVFLICAAVIGIVLVGFVNGLKDIMHRPRFRSIVATGMEFHNWWQPCKNYRELMETFNLSKEEFKSFPSGHTGELGITIITTAILPFVCPKLKKLQMPLFCASVAATLLVAFCRILAAAHFLSDVSMGLAGSALFAFIANEVIIHIKPFHRDEESKAPEAPAEQ